MGTGMTGWPFCDSSRTFPCRPLTQAGTLSYRSKSAWPCFANLPCYLCGECATGASPPSSLTNSWPDSPTPKPSGWRMLPTTFSMMPAKKSFPASAVFWRQIRRSRLSSLTQATVGSQRALQPGSTMPHSGRLNPTTESSAIRPESPSYGERGYRARCASPHVRTRNAGATYAKSGNMGRLLRAIRLVTLIRQRYKGYMEFNWINILLFGGLTLGHAALVVALVNRIHGWPLPLPFLHCLRQLHDLVIVILPGL